MRKLERHPVSLFLVLHLGSSWQRINGMPSEALRAAKQRRRCSTWQPAGSATNRRSVKAVRTFPTSLAPIDDGLRVDRRIRGGGCMRWDGSSGQDRIVFLQRAIKKFHLALLCRPGRWRPWRKSTSVYILQSVAPRVVQQQDPPDGQASGPRPNQLRVGAHPHRVTKMGQAEQCFHAAPFRLKAQKSAEVSVLFWGARYLFMERGNSCQLTCPFGPKS